MQASGNGDAGFGNVSQKFGIDIRQETRGNARSGDAELPGKASLAERRAKMDNVRPFALAEHIAKLHSHCLVWASGTDLAMMSYKYTLMVIIR